MAAFTYYRQNLFSPAIWYQTFIATFLGAVNGTFLVYYIDKEWLEKGLHIIIIAIAIYSLVKHNTISCKHYVHLKESESS